MAFTRNFLKSLGLNDEQVQAVVEEHTAVTDALKQYKADAEKLPLVQKELDELKDIQKEADNWKSKYENEHSVFEQYKSDAEAKKTLDTKRSLYTELLKAENVDEKRIDAILKVTDFDGIRLTKEGKLDGRENLSESIKTEWAGFIVETKDKGTPVDTPPTKTAQGEGDNASYIRNMGKKFHANLYGEEEQ